MNSLYPNILIGLFKEGLIDNKWEKDINKSEWFLKNRNKLKISNPDEYLKWKYHTNSLYGRIKTPLVVEYLHYVYGDLIDKYKDNIIYIHSDMIMLKNDKSTIKDDLRFMNFSFDESVVENFYFSSKARYMIYSEGILLHKGYRDDINRKELLQNIKEEIRNKRLDKILNN